MKNIAPVRVPVAEEKALLNGSKSEIVVVRGDFAFHIVKVSANRLACSSVECAVKPDEINLMYNAMFKPE